jgi:hypothetical protein
MLIFLEINSRFHGISKVECDVAVSQCLECKQSKAVTGSDHVHPIVSTAYGERITVDLKDFNPYIKGMDGGFRYLMVLIDHFSSWVEVFYLKNKEAETVWEHIEKYLQRGVPEIFHTDNGGEFELYISHISPIN